MTGLTALWLPILLSAVFVFIVSSVIHMATPWHKNDFPPLPNEDKVRDALRPLAIPPGDYVMPRAEQMSDMKSPAFQEKLKQGPVVMMTVFPNGVRGMGGQLALWFGYCVVVSVFAAYVTGRALGQSSPYLSVFRFAGVTAFCAYSLALAQASIWYKKAWGSTIRSMIDGLIYGFVTAGTFGWLWPQW
jgi:hypothetical protein